MRGRRVVGAVVITGGTTAAAWMWWRRRPTLAGDPPAWPPLDPPAAEPVSPAAGAVWVEPVDGTCPADHPVKANATSMIYHVPTGVFYDRTNADRCYASAGDAESDGFRAAKR